MNVPLLLRRTLPADATVSRWSAPDGWTLRRFDWPTADGAGRGRVLFLPGRADVFEKYLETIAHLHDAGWSVTSFDWRGQGGSGRLSADPRVGHCPDFAPLVGDLAAFWRDWAAESDAGPRVAISHSMGAHLLLRAMIEEGVDPDAAVLVAPMLGLRGPVGRWLSPRLARFLAARGDPARAAWRQSEKPRAIQRRRRKLTHDIARFQDERWWYDQQPELQLGPPSWGWIVEAFRSCAALAADRRVEALAVPMLMLVAVGDELVDARAALATAARLPDATVERFGRDSAHEILRESLSVQARAFAAIDAFLDARAPAQA